MRKIIFSLFLFFLALTVGPHPLWSEENDFKKIIPENHSGFYSNSDTVFYGTNSRTTFRVWFPVSPDRVWPVLIDTNNWKKVHPSDYKDSRTLDKNQFDRIDHEKPKNTKAFYDLMGDQEFPSEWRRKKGGVWTSMHFQLLGLPWPLHDRWAVMKIKNNESHSAEGKYRYDYKMSVGNFKSLKGYWELFPIPDKPGWTEFRGQYDSDPGISVPQFLGRKIFRGAIKRNAKENLGVMKGET